MLRQPFLGDIIGCEFQVQKEQTHASISEINRQSFWSLQVV